MKQKIQELEQFVNIHIVDFKILVSRKKCAKVMEHGPLLVGLTADQVFEYFFIYTD